MLIPPRYKFFFSVCPETNRVFIWEVGIDNYIAEVFARNKDETVVENAIFICTTLNKNLPQED